MMVSDKSEIQNRPLAVVCRVQYAVKNVAKGVAKRMRRQHVL